MKDHIPELLFLGLTFFLYIRVLFASLTDKDKESDYWKKKYIEQRKAYDELVKRISND